MESQTLSLIHQRRFPEAQTLLAQQLAADPMNPSLLGQMGFLLHCLGEKTAALATLHQAVAAAPQDPRPLVNLANALREDRQQQAAIALYTQAAALAQDHPVILLNLAISHFERRDYSLALETALTGLKSHPQMDRLHFLAAQCLYHVGKPAAAVSHYEAALQQQPHQRQIILGLSTALVSCGRLVAAQKLLEAFLATVGADPELISNLATVYFELGDRARAEQGYRSAVRLAPQLFVTHFNLSRFLQQCDRLEEAYQSITTALTLVNRAPEAIHLAADLAIGLNFLQEATHLLTNLLQQYPQDVDAQVKLAQVYRQQGNLTTALALLNRVWQLGQSSASLLSMLATLDQQDLTQVTGDTTVRHAFDPTCMVYVDQLSLDVEQRQRVIAALRHDSSLVADRPHKPTTGGCQTYELFDGESQSLFGSLGERIIALALHFREIVSAQRPLFLDLPTDPAQIRISGWGVILESGGFQKPHTHPESRVSGVLYLQIPRACHSDRSDAGNLRFPYTLKGESRVHDVVPEVDTIVFFPSYLWHGTVPFVAAEERICIAFNLS